MSHETRVPARCLAEPTPTVVVAYSSKIAINNTSY